MARDYQKLKDLAEKGIEAVQDRLAARSLEQATIGGVFNKDRSPKLCLKLPLVLRLMLWDDSRWDVRWGRQCLVSFDLYRAEVHLGLLSLYQVGKFLGYWLFWACAKEPRLSGRFGIGVRDGFGRGWAEYNAHQ